MNDSNLELFLNSMGKFMDNEITPYRDAFDLYPMKPFPFNLYEKISTTGIFDGDETDEEFSSMKSMARMLLKVSESDAGIGAFMAYFMLGEITRKQYCPEMKSGTTALCLFEENELELDTGSIEFSHTLTDGLLNGVKKSVMLAPLASLFCVFAKSGEDDVIAWIYKDDKNIKVMESSGLLGIRAVPCADVSFDGAKPASVTKIKSSDSVYLFSILSLLLSSCACGTALRAIEKAFAYAKDRYQGGKFIIEYDAIKLMYSKNMAGLKSARAAILQAAENVKKEDKRSLSQCFSAKINASEACVNAALDAIQMHGGYGYMRDYGIEKRFRDAAALSSLPLDCSRTALLCGHE